MTEAELVLFDDTAPAWERAFYAFLAEKERRSGRAHSEGDRVIAPRRECARWAERVSTGLGRESLTHFNHAAARDRLRRAKYRCSGLQQALVLQVCRT